MVRPSRDALAGWNRRHADSLRRWLLWITHDGDPKNVILRLFTSLSGVQKEEFLGFNKLGGVNLRVTLLLNKNVRNEDD